MFATLAHMKLHKFKLQEAMEIWEKSKGKAYQEIDGLLEVTVLVELQQDRLVKIALWESEQHAKTALESQHMQEMMNKYQHLLAEKPVIETFHMAFKVELSKIPVGKK